MVLPEVLDALGLDPRDAAAEELYHELGGKADPRFDDWKMVAAALTAAMSPGRAAVAAPARVWPAWNARPMPLVLGIGGGQGAGKSTLAWLLGQALEMAGARTFTCSIDDFYLTHAAREALAGSVHPLLATRGVPGTHDVDLLARVMADLGRSGVVRVPVFDKGADDVLPATAWRPVEAPVDVLVLEGWCLGARAEDAEALDEPVNDLEAREDRDGVWRRWVNDALAGPYAALWSRIHVLVYLQVPDMAAVLRWRSLQEAELSPEVRMNDDAVRRFVAHYERITRAMQTDLPARADLVVRLDDAHRMAAVFRVHSA